jgi:hypothetical protein
LLAGVKRQGHGRGAQHRGVGRAERQWREGGIDPHEDAVEAHVRELADRGGHDGFPGLEAGARLVLGRKSRNRQVDQAGIAAGHVLGAEAEARHHARAKVLDHHVGRRDQALGDLVVFAMLEVEHDALLAAIEDGIGRGAPARPAGRVDANDLGPLIGQNHADRRSGDVLAEIDCMAPLVLLDQAPEKRSSTLRVMRST